MKTRSNHFCEPRFMRCAILMFNWLRALLCILLAANAGAADSSFQENARSFADMSIEELMNEPVTSVSKKESPLMDSPAAITVISAEDIRRSGFTSIPEALRMVPGMNVARINANEWAISARGFNAQYANNLLVLMDGRTVYTPSFGGVHWNVQDVVLEDLDRIEVIRGPGATLWGANAVNGVINIITKSAEETQGLLASTLYGTEDQPTTSLRYGGQLATNLFYRAYVKYANRDGLVDSAGNGTPDDWDMLRGGLRLDWKPTVNDRFTLQGDRYGGDAGENSTTVSLKPPFSQSDDVTHHNAGGNVLARWTHDFSTSSQLELQTYYDHFRHGDSTLIETRDTFDVDLQHRIGLGARHDIVWGGRYRHTADRLTPSFGLTFTPERRQDQLFSTFVQDEITLVEERLHLTLGSKFEHNDYTGFEVQPSARLLWKPTSKQAVWSAVSRAVRTPTRFEENVRLNLAAFQPPGSPPILLSMFGNPDLDSERLIAHELGYRIGIAKRLSFEVAGFYNRYDDLVDSEPGADRFEASPPPAHLLLGPLVRQNSGSGNTYGVETSAQWKMNDRSSLVAGYTLLKSSLGSASDNRTGPQNQFHLRLYRDLPHHLEFNSAVYYVDRVETLAGGATAVFPSYVRLDVGMAWRPTESLEIGVWGQNLLENQHSEFGSQKTSLRTEIPRTVLGKITLRY